MRFKDLAEEILTIAKRGTPTTAEVARIESILAGRKEQLSEQERHTLTAFFWGNAGAPIWLSALRKHISKCPSAVETEKGYQVPVWLAEPYLRAQIARREEGALSVLLDIDTNNARFYEVAAEASLIFDRENVRALLPLLIEFANNPFSLTKRMLPRVLVRFVADGFIQEALLLAAEIVSFGPDPAEQEKAQRRQANPDDWGTSLEPRPKLEQWEYQEALEKGIRQLAAAASFDTARLLIATAADMLRFKSRDGQEPWSDTSEIWAPRLTERKQHDLDPKSALIRALTYACEQVYEQAKTPVMIESLDRILRKASWLVFTRVRHHLYSQHPEQTKHWIEAAVVEYPDYERHEYRFEFQQMIRMACEHFGDSILSKDYLEQIFERILSGPDHEAFKEWMGDEYTEEKYIGRQRHFHLAQLHPFRAILFGRYKQVYQSLLKQQRSPTDEDYAPYSSGETKTGGSRSPKSPEELGVMSDDELIGFLNSWEDVRRDPEQWWIDIDFRGLGTALKQTIQRDPDRFLGWGRRWQSLSRPIYLSYVLDLAKERISAGGIAELDKWFELAEWIVEQPLVEPEPSTPPKPGPDIRNWDSARRAVVDLIETCLKDDVKVPSERRAQIFALLKVICLGPDTLLDSDKPIMTPRDYLTDAINTTRGRAIQNLIQYGFWVRHRQGNDSDISEVFTVIGERVHNAPPLTKPEYALLGSDFNRLCALDAKVSRDYASAIFPLERPDEWRVSFGTYLNWSHAYKPLFDLLRPHLSFALENIHFWKDGEKRREDPIAKLGEHLFAHYVWANDVLERDDSLLRRFYSKTSEEEWATLFDHVGRSLNNTPPDIDVALKERCKAFFEFRLAAANARELQEFTFWLGAECLEPEWRLDALGKTLAVTEGQTAHRDLLVEGLLKLLADHSKRVVQSFAQLIRGAVMSDYFYLESDKVKPILEAGLSSSDPATREAALDTQDNLLRAGRFEYLAMN